MEQETKIGRIVALDEAHKVRFAVEMESILIMILFST